MDNLTDEDYSDIIFEDHPDYDTVVSQYSTDQSRWSTCYEMVCAKGDKFYKLSWERGSTEYHEVDPDYKMWEVKPVEKTAVVYE